MNQWQYKQIKHKLDDQSHTGGFLQQKSDHNKNQLMNENFSE